MGDPRNGEPTPNGLAVRLEVCCDADAVVVDSDCATVADHKTDLQLHKSIVGQKTCFK